ncbi:MAG TPA: hypothetical protein PKM25_10885 [Candidatus Ozemobacteraceae bacterium]|nr:hypothetical protein [Candidatus Ozemobacteraceae bacterium]
MMDKKKVFFIGAGILVMGSLSWAASSTPHTGAMANMGRHAGVPSPTGVRNSAVNPVAAPAPAAVQPGALSLVPPPAELPRAGSQAMVTSVKPMAPAVAANRVTGGHAKNSVAARSGKTAAPAKKPGKLFSYVRMLNFSPHPQEEEFLKDKPLALNGHNYWLKVSYKESWDVTDDESGNLQNLAFDIKLMEGEKVVRNLQTPSVKIDAKNVRRGQVLGIAEVAPYKFNIAVDTFNIIDGGVNELVFKFDLTS